MANPSDLTAQRGYKDTADNASQEKPLEISDEIWMHDPNANKGLGWALTEGRKKEAVFNHIFGHLEDAPLANWVQYAGADEAVQAATGIVLATGHGPRVTLGSRIYWPRTKEVMRLNAVMSTDTTGAVGRNFGRGVSTSYLKKGDYGLVIAPAFQQGFTTGVGMTTNKSYKAFATSEVSYPLDMTYVEATERARGGDAWEYALSKVIKQAKDQMEGELLYGGKVVDDSEATYSAPISTSEGLDNYITTHRYVANSISRMDLWDIIGEWRAHAKRGGAILSSQAFKNMVTMWAMTDVRYVQATETDGMEITTIKTPAGIYDIIEIDLLNQEPHLMGEVFFLPKGQIGYRYLSWNGNLDLRYNPISRDEVHSKEGELYGVYGWEFFMEETMAKLETLQFAA